MGSALEERFSFRILSDSGMTASRWHLLLQTRLASNRQQYIAACMCCRHCSFPRATVITYLVCLWSYKRNKKIIYCFRSVKCEGGVKIPPTLFMWCTVTRRARDIPSIGRADSRVPGVGSRLVTLGNRKLCFKTTEVLFYFVCSA